MQVYIDLEALAHNAQYILSAAGDKHVAAVVKGDAYGHGISLVVPVLMSVGIKRFVVSNLKEAIALWNLGASWILVLHPSLDEMKELADLYVLHNAIRLTIWDSEHLEGVPKGIPVHIAMNTGFGMGFSQFPKGTGVFIEGIMGHVPFLDDTPQHDMLRKKIWHTFMDTASYYADKYSISEIHLCNSASLFYLNGCKGTTMVRTGVGLYGYIEKHDIMPQLKPVMYQVAKIVTIAEVLDGDTVFYGDPATHKMTVAYVRTGYGDGYVPALWAYHIPTKRFIKRVFDLTMNISAFDITGIDAHVDDDVLLLGHLEKLRADNIGKSLGISTEKVLTRAGLARRQALPDAFKDLLQS